MIPFTISPTKRVNTSWIPSPVEERIHAKKMKSCLGFCSQRACAASCSGLSCSNLALEIGNAFCSDLCWDALGHTGNPIALFCQSCWVTSTHGLNPQTIFGS